MVSSNFTNRLKQDAHITPSRRGGYEPNGVQNMVNHFIIVLSLTKNRYG